MKQQLQSIFDNLIANEQRPLELRGVGRKPGKPKRTQIVGATVTDINQIDPSDGGVLTNSGFPIFSTISMDDVNQGQLSDCYLLAMLAAIAATDRGKFYLQGTTIKPDPAAQTTRAIVSYFRAGLKTQIHCDLLVATGFNQYDPNNRDLWVELIEKTYALFRTGADTYASLNFGMSQAVASDLGLLPVGFVPLAQSTVFAAIRSNLANQVPTTIATPTAPGFGLVGGHEYTVIGIDSLNNVTLRNPWGLSGGTLYTTLTPDQFWTVNHTNISYVEFGVLPVPPVVIVPAPSPLPIPVPIGPTLKGLDKLSSNSIPGTINAGKVTELDGGLKTETNTLDGSIDIGYVGANDQAFFLLNNATARIFQFSFLCATPYPSSSFDVYVGQNKVGTVQVPGTSAWNKYVACQLANVQVPAGLVPLTLVFTVGNLNLNSFTAT